MTPKELKTWRRLNGYNQRQLAELLGVVTMTVSKWERGVRKIPSFLHLALKCMEKKEVTKVVRVTKTKTKGG